MDILSNYQEFTSTLKNINPEESWPQTLKALWYDTKGDWHTAHEIVDGMNGATAKWIHAYLHRNEGDEWNAGYWYRQAGRAFPKVSLDDERQEIIEFILSKQ